MPLTCPLSNGKVSHIFILQFRISHVFCVKLFFNILFINNLILRIEGFEHYCNLRDLLQGTEHALDMWNIVIGIILYIDNLLK